MFKEKSKKNIVIFILAIFLAFFIFFPFKESLAILSPTYSKYIPNINVDPDGINNPEILEFYPKEFLTNSVIILARIDTNNIFTQLKLFLYKQGADQPLFTGIKNILPSLSPSYIEFNVFPCKENTNYQVVLLARNIKGYEDEKEISFQTPNSFNNQTDQYQLFPTSTQEAGASIQNKRPDVYTKEFQQTSSSGGELIGLVNPKDSSTLVWFEWGKNLNLENKTPPEVVNGNNFQNIKANIYGLSGGLKYYYRLVAKNKNGLSFGETKSFLFLKFKKPSPIYSSQKQIKISSNIKKTATVKNSFKTRPSSTVSSSPISIKNNTFQTAKLADSLKELFNNKAFWIIFSLLFIFIVYLIFKK